MQVAIRRHDWRVRRNDVAPLEVGHAATGLSHQQQTGGDVPRRETQLPEAIKSPAGDGGQVKRGASGAPEAALCTRDALELPQVGLDEFEILEREAGPDECAVWRIDRWPAHRLDVAKG